MMPRAKEKSGGGEGEGHRDPCRCRLGETDGDERAEAEGERGVEEWLAPNERARHGGAGWGGGHGRAAGSAREVEDGFDMKCLREQVHQVRLLDAEARF